MFRVFLLGASVFAILIGAIWEKNPLLWGAGIITILGVILYTYLRQTGKLNKFRD